MKAEVLHTAAPIPPRAGLVILSGTLVQFGLPLQGVAVILGVDAFMGMARTSLNLVGNCLATVLMARWDGSFELTADALRVQQFFQESSPTKSLSLMRL